jgi:chemotaxis protein CheD
MMATCMAVESVENRSVGMGQVVLATAPVCLSAVLGSCVGVAIYHRRRKLGALAHVVLADSTGRISAPGKFADTAIPYMLGQLETQGAPHSQLTVKIAGGACMFGVGGPLQIGDANVQAIHRILATLGLRLQAEEVGGTKGRRITFDCATGELLVQVVGETPRRL